ncbi:hypothetical protein C3L33_02069, partial [Rhododendron williamsianum]
MTTRLLVLFYSSSPPPSSNHTPPRRQTTSSPNNPHALRRRSRRRRRRPPLRHPSHPVHNRRLLRLRRLPRGIPPGTYLTATVFLKSGVVLDIQKGAKILGGTKLEDYPREQSRWYVVVAEDAAEVGITGGGVIDGQGLEFVERFDERKNVMVSWNRTGACFDDECRPRLVGFLRCRDVRVWTSA